MEKYNPKKIEKKWQKLWERRGFFKAKDFSKNPKFYVLVEFPYPSGEGLHVGHCRSYTALDIFARKRRMQGCNVLFPMGWDAFGLPTENYAIKTGIQPALATKRNTDVFRKQLKNLGFSFDWSREINTTDLKYYKWTQWIFLKLFENGLAYKAKMPINWCPSCKIGLANEEVVVGNCERCGTKVERKEKEQWLIKITEYADRLIDDLKRVDYLEKIKTQQINWIGKSQGVEVYFKIEGFVETIKVFTTRIDTIFGVTAVVLSPENELVKKITKENYKQKVEEYINVAKRKSEFERTQMEKEKTGVFIGAFCINPANMERIPIWMGDYVVSTYGGGAVMMVPGHDKRDYEFAKKYGLEIKEVVKGGDISKEAFVGFGILANSGQFNGLNSEKAIEEITKWLTGKKAAKRKINYKLRDWIFSRQHYWGEPIPLVFCQKCGWVAVPEKDLPLKLPKVKKYQPADTGESPLAAMEKWVNVKCPKCKGLAKRETDVMPNWAGSNWYYIRYCDPKNRNKLADSKLLKYWMPVDLYNGGMEHVTLHLLYSRFIFKFLWDIGAVPKEIGSEPYKKRIAHGLILGEGGVKMSKSKGNVVNPDDVVKKYGADTMRLYEMFIGPFEDYVAWDTKGIEGVSRFLQKVWRLSEKSSPYGGSPTGRQILPLREISRRGTNPPPTGDLPQGDKSQKNPKPQITNYKLKILFNKTIKKVTEDIENFRFNTAVSAMMILVNEMTAQKENMTKEDFKNFLVLLSVFAPFIAEELWAGLKFKGSIQEQEWPKYDQKFIKEEKINLIVQINGKVRDKIEAESGITEEKAKKIALSREKVVKWIADKKPKKIIFVPNRLINIVI